MLPELGLISIARRIARRFGRGFPSFNELWKGYNLNQLQRYESLLRHHGLSLDRFSSILDFGCGRGRHSEHLCYLANEAKIYGCDVDATALGEARRLCPRAEFSSINILPPLEYDNEQFDLIFSFSVFTQLSEPTHQAWLKELARTLKPGGVMIHTTHSYEYLRQTIIFSPEQLAKYQFQQPIEEFLASNQAYYYIPYSPATPEYGLAIISKEYAIANWPKITGLLLIDYVEAAIESYPEGCHDMVMLKKE